MSRKQIQEIRENEENNIGAGLSTTLWFDEYTGVPHRLLKDDFYKGYCISKGLYIIVNMW